MADALIGYTGFVGGNLARQRRFEGLYNSKNIEDLAGRSYDLVVCAGAPAEKWKANKEPEADAAALARLMGPLGKARARRVILVSTVDVYPSPIEVTEESPIDLDACHAYGRNRLALERFVQERFDTVVARLPGLFGDGLKKNAIYDLLNQNQVQAIHSEGVFQFYGLDSLWADLERFAAQGLKVVNVATEPVSVRELAREAFGLDFRNVTDRPPARYDFRTVHAGVLGGERGYLQDKARVLRELKAFVARAPRSTG